MTPDRYPPSTHTQQQHRIHPNVCAEHTPTTLTAQIDNMLVDGIRSLTAAEHGARQMGHLPRVVTVVSQALHTATYMDQRKTRGEQKVIRYLAIREIAAWGGMVHGRFMEYTAGRWSHMAARHYQKRFKDSRRASGNISLRRV